MQNYANPTARSLLSTVINREKGTKKMRVKKQGFISKSIHALGYIGKML